MNNERTEDGEMWRMKVWKHIPAGEHEDCVRERIWREMNNKKTEYGEIWRGGRMKEWKHIPAGEHEDCVRDKVYEIVCEIGCLRQIYAA
jgi:hypothetical protein